MLGAQKKIVVIIDNYDSFVYNIGQYCSQLGAEVVVYRNDEITKENLPAQTTHLIISPGPATPSQAGISNEMILFWSGKLPILGVCLGHQCIGEVFGGKIIKAQKLMHGKISNIHHDGKGVFANISENPLAVVRYHSLVVANENFPKELVASAILEDDFQNQTNGDIMALRHKDLPIEGVQFHPEAYYTNSGMKILNNFLAQKIN